LAKSSQARAKRIKEKSLDSLVRFEPFQWVAAIPWEKNLSCLVGSPAALAVKAISIDALDPPVHLISCRCGK
jgi:hypothetical protein